jgi:hypothetical protein
LEDGWWTEWTGPDVSLTLDQKVERAASIAEEITGDNVRGPGWACKRRVGGRRVGGRRVGWKRAGEARARLLLGACSF